jgi:uncharacterized membrane protein YeaQ/YmgE (transglycosylase-associated protein family)
LFERNEALQLAFAQRHKQENAWRRAHRNWKADMHILWIILVGLVAGIIARNLLPGPNNPSGFILTTVLGIAGAFVATYLGQHMGWYRLDQGAGFIGATLGAVLVLFVWHRLVVTRTVTDPTTRDPLGPRRWL